MKSHKQRSQRGASLVEYALLVSLIAVVAIVSVSVLGRKVSSRFCESSAQIFDGGPCVAAPGGGGGGGGGGE